MRLSCFQNLTRRKDSVDEKTQTEDTDCDLLDPTSQKSYPFAVVLRLRVLQVNNKIYNYLTIFVSFYLFFIILVQSPS